MQKTTEWIVMEFGSDIHVPLRMNCNHFDFLSCAISRLTFLLVTAKWTQRMIKMWVWDRCRTDVVRGVSDAVWPSNKHFHFDVSIATWVHTSRGWPGQFLCAAPPACLWSSCQTSGWAFLYERLKLPHCLAGWAPRRRSRSGGHWWWKGQMMYQAWCWISPVKNTIVFF